MIKEDKEAIEEIRRSGIQLADSFGSEKPQSREMHLIGHSSLDSSQSLDGDRLYLDANAVAQPLVVEFRLADSYSKVSC